MHVTFTLSVYVLLLKVLYIFSQHEISHTILCDNEKYAINKKYTFIFDRIIIYYSAVTL